MRCIWNLLKFIQRHFSLKKIFIIEQLQNPTKEGQEKEAGVHLPFQICGEGKRIEEGQPIT
jgi:hypothetical protein